MDMDTRHPQDCPRSDHREVSGRVALFGGVYNNHIALSALLADAPSPASEIFCLRAGDGVRDRAGEAPDAAFAPLRFDHDRLVEEMRAERIVEPFVNTVESGWWTTCLEILPSRERARGMYCPSPDPLPR